MYLLIISIPLFSAITVGFFSKFFGHKGAPIIAIIYIIATFLLSCNAFYEVALAGSPCYLILGTWINSGMFYVPWGFLFDTLTVVMLVVITSISMFVHIYSMEYMAHDPHLPRFMSYLSLFTFFMIILVTADNFLQMFVGWEGVGLCSYLLINFWFSRIQANKAAIKAMVVNRIGDFGLALGILAIFYHFKSIDYNAVFALNDVFVNQTFIFFNYEVDVLTFITLCLFVGAVGKSAQLGLHTWLPDAMEGPTPVSALIHAATMVTAGVFLIGRCSPLFEYAPLTLMVVTIVGGSTAFFAATTGLLQNDLKRVIAYSTCSQLGYMVFACGISSYNVGIFHLSNHAFFKALLFLGAGSVIHAMGDEQDMRKMGGLKNILPFTYSVMLIGSLSLMGFPFLTGFYSKDVILELAYAKFSVHSHFAYWLGTISAFFTAFYSIRLLYLTFLSKTRAFKQIILQAHDAPILMAIPLFFLSFGSIFIGYLSKDMFIGLGTSFWNNSIFILPENMIFIDAEFLPTHIKLIPLIFSFSGACSAFYFYTYFTRDLFLLKTSRYGKLLYIFLNRKWFFDKVYNDFVTQSVLYFGYHISYKLIDRGVIELLGPYGLVQLFYSKALNFTKTQSGYIYHYGFVMLLGLTVIIFEQTCVWQLTSFIESPLYLITFITLLVLKNNKIG